MFAEPVKVETPEVEEKKSEEQKAEEKKSDNVGDAQEDTEVKSDNQVQQEEIEIQNYDTH